MKFLVLQKIRLEVPVKEWTKLLPAQFKYLEELENGGRIEVSYHLIGQQGNLLTVDVDSDGEFTRIVDEDLLFFHSEREVYSLTTRETHKDYL